MTATAKKLSIRLEAVGGDKVRSEFKSLGTDGQKAFRQITQVIQPANDNLLALSNTAKTFNGILKQTAGLFGAYLGASSLMRTFKGIVSINKEFESLSGSLKTVTGSAQGAKEAFAIIEKFALDTPYQLEEIVEAFIRLKALGLEPSMEALTSYGNTASAFGKGIMDFTEALSNAVMFNFRSLRSFGIMATTEKDKVNFTFQGITATVAKNAKAIEAYLRSLGNVQFAGAMKEQMDTMGGVMSNIEDAFGKLARNIGEAGLTTAIKNALQQFNDMVDGAEDAATSIGKGLTTAVNLAANAFFFLAKHADVAIELLTIRLGSKGILGGLTLLRAGIGYLQASLAGMSVQAKSAVAGIAMMSNVSKLAAVQMGVLATATGVLRGALALIGGPAGLAVLACMALYKLVDSHDVAKRAAHDHAETLKKLQDELKATAETAAHVSEQQKHDMAVAEWGLKYKTAKQNVEDLEKELKETGGLSWRIRYSPDAILEDYEIYAKDMSRVLRQSRIDIEQYQKEIWEIAAEFPDFQPQAKAFQDKLLLLKAAKQDMYAAYNELKYLENPELRPKEETKTVTPTPTPSFTPKTTNKSAENAYKRNIEDIKNKLLELKTPYEQAMAKADQWKENALKNLRSSAAGYEDYKKQIEQVYDNMVKKADETALATSKKMEDGFKRGFIGLKKGVDDFATLAESAVRNAFNNMENALVSFVTTGKASISDLVNAIIQDFAKLAIRQSITQPLMASLSAYMGFGTAHTG
ncbi:MAG: hypothetical protein IJ529_02415, partial [Alphaproteobacteria bacterium]|nr:hypothetical protein [Alphaproteobacteria bacterium]